ncbi:reverse transcriptase domain-containing protein [Imbroritus primus]|uniref:reverse transcriptase domain-containing protein n=1 Tax=Imbroritus primus TaxID=3058603 RepID=UPI003D161319
MRHSSNAYQRVFTRAQLTTSFRELFGSARPTARNTVGIDDICLNDFAADPKGQIHAIASELNAGLFKFSALRAHLIPKMSGKDRLICVPTVRDRVVQRTLLRYLSNRYHNKLANKISYGFVQGRTVQQAANAACQLRASHRWVLKTDICSFFDQIDRNILAASIKRLVRERSLHNILVDAISSEIGPVSRSKQKRISALGIKDGHGVRQGMPLSPFFSNVILQSFDKKIEESGLRAIRYADDLVFFADSRESCKVALEKCTDILSELHLTVPGLEEETKTVIYEPDQPAEFLGLGIRESSAGYELALLPRQREAIRRRILDLGSLKELLARKITLANLGTAIANRISGYVAAYDCCSNIDDLERELNSLGTKVRRRIYRDELQIPLAALGADARAFLDI